jgi:predicted MFS family arabinose efflux permease
MAGETAGRDAWLPASLGLIAGASVFSITIGLSYPLLALKLNAAGIGDAMIGANAAVTPLGMILSAPFVPRLTRRLGPWAVLLACTVATALLLLLIGATEDATAWFPLRFLLGGTTSALFVVTEAGVLESTPARVRGRVMGAYTTSVTLGYALGPLILVATGHEGRAPFAAAVAILAAAVLVMLAARAPLRGFLIRSGGAGSVGGFLARAPVILVACAAVAAFDNASMSFLALYVAGEGLDIHAGNRMLSVLLLGGTVLQYPIGWIADRTSVSATFLGCAAVGLAGCAVFPAILGAGPLLWGVLVLWGGAVIGVYTMALAELGARFSGAELVTGNAAVAVTWGIGSLVGVPAAGAAMEAAGGTGLLTVLAVPFAVLLVMVALRRTGRGA